MATFKLQPNCFLLVTPEGAYHCVSSPTKSPIKSLLKWLLDQPLTPELNEELFENIKIHEQSPEDIKDLLYHAQSYRWVEAINEEKSLIDGNLEDVLPSLLPTLSSEEKVLLADAQGFYLFSSGFSEESAERFSALSADLASLHERHESLLHQNLGFGLNAWGIIDAAGNSQIGFWPMYIGEHRFVLMVDGIPRLNQTNLTNIISILSIRYS